jgi:hypothetical protein
MVRPTSAPAVESKNEQVEFLDNEAEGDHRDTSSYPGEEGALIGGMLCEVSDHGGSPEGRISGRLGPFRGIVTTPLDGGERLIGRHARAPRS